MAKCNSIQKLERILIAGYDIGMPYDVGDPWLILNPEDDEVAEGVTLEDAVNNLREDFYGAFGD